MWRLRPTWRPPSPERCSSSGVPRAPPAAIDGAAGADGEGAAPAAAPAEVEQLTPAARPSSTRTRLDLDAGADPRPGGDRARQVADVHAALGVDLAAEGTGAALHAAAGVAVDRGAAGADRGRALHRQLAVAAHPLGVELGDVEEAPRPRRSRRPYRRPRRCRSAASSPRGPGSGARKQVPELITVVPPTTLATGTGIGGRPSAMVRPPSR